MKSVLIDRDGVLMYAKDGAIVPGAQKFILNLRSQKTPFLIATNHSTSSIEDAVMELRGSGFAVKYEEVHTPFIVLDSKLSLSRDKRLYVRGTEEFKKYLTGKGFNLREDARVDIVLLAFDRNMDYRALSTAISAIMESKAELIAMHENRIFKSKDGGIEPGLGAWVRAVEYATGVKSVIMGKPSKDYYMTALSRLGVKAADSIMISDDPLGDLTGAKSLGMKTIFVLSGQYSSCDVLDRLELKLKPDVIRKTIADITPEDLR